MIDLVKLNAIKEDHERLSASYRSLSGRLREAQRRVTEVRTPPRSASTQVVDIFKMPLVELDKLSPLTWQALGIPVDTLRKIVAAQTHADQLYVDLMYTSPIVQRSAQLIAKLEEYARGHS